MTGVQTCALPILSEGFPISAVEAQASGLVCFLSDRISKEVDLRPEVYHLSIDRGPGAWIEKLTQANPTPSNIRKEAYLDVKMAGFDEACTKNYVISLYQHVQQK